MTEFPSKSSHPLLRQTSVVGSVSLAKSLDVLQTLATADHADILELRLDHYPEALDHLKEAVSSLAIPTLITARCPAEGGKNSLSADERTALVRPFLGNAAMVDVEIASLHELQPLVAEIHVSPTLLVASFHDFKGTPTLSTLETLIDQALASKADAVKFATTLNGPADLATLISLLALENRPPISVMGMGPLGKISRLVLARLGSILNYGYLDAPTVPGQWDSGRLKSLLYEISQP